MFYASFDSAVLKRWLGHYKKKTARVFFIFSSINMGRSKRKHQTSESKKGHYKRDHDYVDYSDNEIHDMYEDGSYASIDKHWGYTVVTIL